LTEELIDLVESDGRLAMLLEKSIAKASEANPDKATNPAQTLEEYYDFLDWAATCLPWNVLKDQSGGLYEHIDQSLDYFYFLVDQPLEELEGQGYYNNSLQYVEPFRSWIKRFVQGWGEYLSSEDSWSDEYYELAYADPRFGLQNGWYEDPSNWHSFNDFFSRYLSSESARPIAAPEDDSVVVSPADAVPQGTWQIDENSELATEDGVHVKSSRFNSIAMLLGEDNKYRDAFAGGTLTHTFLDVNDYHRYHFPVSGTILDVGIIPQDDAVGGRQIWDAEKGKYVLESQAPGWQMIETRGYVIIETAEYGLVAVVPVGMSQVSSVNFEDTVVVGATVEKGDMLGCFLFGGSDIIMLFQKGAGFELTAPASGDGSYEHLLMGEEYGRLRGGSR
jgi:phosphatidylserine decarboxylase precursor